MKKGLIVFALILFTFVFSFNSFVSADYCLGDVNCPAISDYSGCVYLESNNVCDWYLDYSSSAYCYSNSECDSGLCTSDGMNPGFCVCNYNPDCPECQEDCNYGTYCGIDNTCSTAYCAYGFNNYNSCLAYGNQISCEDSFWNPGCTWGCLVDTDCLTDYYCELGGNPYGHCTAITYPCGDGIVQTGETCDDTTSGNPVSGDGCSSTCQIEPGYTCVPYFPNCCYTTIPTYNWLKNEVPFNSGGAIREGDVLSVILNTNFCYGTGSIYGYLYEGTNLLAGDIYTRVLGGSPGSSRANYTVTSSFMNSIGIGTSNIFFRTLQPSQKDSPTVSLCTNTCSSLGYNCGTQTICGESVNCGTCVGGNCIFGECISYTCGNGGVPEPGEECDNGASNGVVCTPPYGGSCNYCSSSCTIITVTGPNCGDGTCSAVNGETCSTCASDCGCSTGYECSSGVCTSLCDLTSASWNQTNSLTGQVVRLNIAGTNCNGRTISFTVMEKDGFLNADDAVTPNPSNIIFSGVNSYVTWNSVFQSDTDGGQSNPPEYYFIVNVVGYTESIESSNSGDNDPSLLTVTQPSSCGDGTCNGGETCTSCLVDCGACPPVCGNSIIEGTEQCDCGTNGCTLSELNSATCASRLGTGYTGTLSCYSSCVFDTSLCVAPCTPETNTAFCSRLGKNCGSVTANDNCGNSRTVTSCGNCGTGQTCTNNVCVDSPTGNIFYISPSGSDSSGTGSITNPWFTLNRAWTSVSAGDTIYVRGGTYRFNSQQRLTGKSGVLGSLIKIWAYPGETPIFTKSTSYTAPSWPNGLVYLDADYTHWKGMEISYYTQATTGIWYGMVLYSANHNTIEQMNSHHNGHGLIIRYESSNNLVLNSDFHHNSDPLSPDAYGDADGLEVAYLPVGSTNTIRGCRFWWNTDDGLDLWNNEGNVIVENSWAWNNGFIPDTFNEGGNGNGFKLGATNVSSPTTVLRTITNSLAFHNKMWGFQENGAQCNIELNNNIAYQNCYMGYSTWCGGFHFSTAGIPYYLKNNIAYNNVLEESSLNVLTNVNHNNWDSAVSVSNSDFVSLDSSQLENPRKADGSLPDITFLHLSSTSDLIDKGVNVGLTYSGSAPDLGAFEYSSLTCTPETDIVFCSRLGKNCGSLTASDNCGNSRTVTNCGNCGTGQTCTNNVCVVSSCTDSCLSSGYNCGTQTICGASTNCGSCGTGYVCSLGRCVSSSKIILTREGITLSNTLDTWLGDNIPRNSPTALTYRNNRIASTSTYGYMLQAGNEGNGPENNMLDESVITGNYFDWNGANLYGSVHGCFTGYQKDVVVKYNYLDSTPMGVIRKSFGMANTPGRGVVGYNIFKNNGLTSVVIKGMQNVNVYNNVFYSNQHMYVGPNDGTWRGIVEIYPNEDITPMSDYSTGTKIKNNIFYTTNQIYNIHVYYAGDLAGFESDYNVFYCEAGTPIFNYLGQRRTFAEWQALGYDTHSVVINPNFIDTVNFVPSARLDYGTNLGEELKAGLSTTATWTLGSSPTTTNQNGAWQVGARIY